MPDLELFTASDLADIDVVYYVRNGEKNDELALSLRSLAHFPHRRVHIVGHTPRWVKNVNSIPGNRLTQASGWANGLDNVHLISRYRGTMTDKVVIFNDDFIVLEPVDVMPLYYRGGLEEHVYVLDLDSSWGESMIATLDRLEEIMDIKPLSYELHVPMPVRRSLLAEALSWGHGSGERPHDPALQWRTLYGNYLRVRHGVTGVQRDDVKVKGRSHGPIVARDFLSTSDRTWRRPRVQGAVRGRVPATSRYVA